jgi:hypothetical protein
MDVPCLAPHTAHHVSTTENAKSSVDHPQNSGLEGLFKKKKQQQPEPEP